MLKNPWNLTSEQKERLSTLVRWNSPIVRVYYLKESFQLFWDYKQEKRAQDLLSKWMNSAMRSRLEPFKKFVRMLRSHLDGILPWTKLRLSNGAIERMNNKIKSISHRSFWLSPGELLHCGHLSLLCQTTTPGRKLITLSGEEPESVEERTRLLITLGFCIVLVKPNSRLR